MQNNNLSQLFDDELQEVKVIVLTPVKNEGWILDRFLSITSKFADQIIVADQSSFDDSLDICKRYPKVIVISNHDTSYGEDSRQQLLIETARRLFPSNKRILFGLDADEIIAADGLASDSWSRIKLAAPGTTFYFEKPELIQDTYQCVRWRDSFFPLAYVDDNAPHTTAKKVHSRRLPKPAFETRVDIADIKFMHYALTREKVQSAKMRYYSVQENIHKTRNVLARRHWYKAPFKVRSYVPLQNIEQTPESWFQDFPAEMRRVLDLDISWHDFELLKIFGQHGTRPFYLDNIWHFDWEYCRQHGLAAGIPDIPRHPIRKAPKIYQILGKALDAFYYLALALRKKINL